MKATFAASFHWDELTLFRRMRSEVLRQAADKLRNSGVYVFLQ